MNIVPESPSVLRHSAARTAIIAGVIFFIAHFAMLFGLTTPEKFYFDEVHYVPAARQMLEPVMPANPVLSGLGIAESFQVNCHVAGSGVVPSATQTFP